MNHSKKAIIAGSLIAGAVFGAADLNAASGEMFRFNELGSGATVRAKLLNQSETDIRAFLLELSCGENAKQAPETKKTDDKSKEAKCGEGKCGESKGGDKKSTEMKSETKADTTATTKDSKSMEGKCGEGKCGVE